MAVSLSRFSWWLWGGKENEPVSNSSPLNNSSSEWGFALKEPETLKFPLIKESKIDPFPRKVRRKWHSREERRIDREFDMVLVPSDGGGCLSGSESDDSDWSVGWMEPHDPDFLSDDESDNSFAVLVPCYNRPGYKEMETNELLSVIKNLPNEFSSADKNCMEQWLASLENF